MRRVSVQEAFADQSAQGSSAAEAGSEAVILSVRGGELIAVVPAGTPDEAGLGVATRIRCSLRLENEHVLTFEVRGAAGSMVLQDREAEFHVHHAPRPFGVAQLPGGGRALQAGQIMTRAVMTASPDELVEDIAKRMAFHNISGMPVEDWDGKLIGVVSEADVIQKLGILVSDVMSAEVIAVEPAASLEHIVNLMGERRIKRVPVLDEGKLVGIVSRGDIVRAMAAQSGSTA